MPSLSGFAWGIVFAVAASAVVAVGALLLAATGVIERIPDCTAGIRVAYKCYRLAGRTDSRRDDLAKPVVDAEGQTGDKLRRLKGQELEEFFRPQPGSSLPRANPPMLENNPLAPLREQNSPHPN
jgi:hypothetical protein